MITEAVIGALLAVGEFIVAALPAAGSLGLQGFAPFVGLAKSMDAGLPVTEALIAFGLLLTIASGIFVTRLVIMARHFVWPF